MTVDIERFALGLADPMTTAAGTIDEREGFLVRVTVDGVTGLGEATPLAGWTESLADCRTALERIDDPERVVDESGPRRFVDVPDPERSPDEPDQEHVIDSLADLPAARHGVSLAVLDARARAVGSPLYRYLGGPERRERLPVNATVGDGDPVATADSASEAVEAGFPSVKVKVGARSVEADLERLGAVRERCPSVELRADANGAWDRPTAERALAGLADLDVSLVEQPLPPADLEGHAALRGGDVAVALDEGLLEHDLEAILDAGAADVAVVKPMALGGVDVARRLAVRAREAGVEPLVTTTVDGAVARAGAVHLAASLPVGRPCGLATADRLRSDLRDDVAPVEDGSIAVPHGKGNGPPS